MNSRVEFLISAQNYISVKFIKFMKIVARNPDAVICLFEGEDEKYYGIRLDLAVPKFEFEGIDCGGKSQVLALFDLVSQHNEYKKSLAAYFVDKDFDLPLAGDVRTHIYETPCYSVENFYTNLETLKKVLKVEFKIDSDGDERDLYTQCLETYAVLQRKFHDTVRPINSWIKAHRKLELNSSTAKLNLSQVKIEQVVTVSLNDVVSTWSPQKIIELFPKCGSLGDEDVEEAEASFDSDQIGYQFRGKYELDFLRIFLACLREDTKRPDSPFRALRGRIKLQLSRTNVISELSQYASTPRCLRDYIAAISQRAAQSSTA